MPDRRQSPGPATHLLRRTPARGESRTDLGAPWNPRRSTTRGQLGPGRSGRRAGEEALGEDPCGGEPGVRAGRRIPTLEGAGGDVSRAGKRDRPSRLGKRKMMY